MDIFNINTKSAAELSCMTIIDRANVRGTIEGYLIDKLDSSDTANILELLNSINNQGITSIDINNYTYCVGGKKFRFSNLSTSELLFLLAYAADKAKEKVYFCSIILQLTRTTLKKFINRFHNSTYVNILYKDSNNVILEGYVKGEIR